MEKFKIEIDRREIVETINKGIHDKIREQMNAQSKQIEASIADHFKRSFFNEKKNEFESALDYTIETSFRDGLELAMKEMKFKELIAEKAKELLSDDNLIQELAEAKVRSSLGLPLK